MPASVDPQPHNGTFWRSLPGGPGLFWPMFIVALLAAIVASQALISAVFQITYQAIAQGFFPRFHVYHKSREHKGQVQSPACTDAGKSLCAKQPLDTCRLAMLSGTSSRREMRLTDVLGLCAGVHTLCQLRAVYALPGGHLHLSDIRPPGCSLWCGHDFTPMSFREHGRCM